MKLRKTFILALFIGLSPLPIIFWGCQRDFSPVIPVSTPVSGGSITFSRTYCGSITVGNDIAVTVCNVICNNGPIITSPVQLIDNSTGAGFQFTGWGWNGTFPYSASGATDNPRLNGSTVFMFTNGLAAASCVTVQSVFENTNWPNNACQNFISNASVSIFNQPLLDASVTVQVPCAPSPTATLTPTPTYTTSIPLFTPTSSLTPTTTKTITPTLTSTQTPTYTTSIPLFTPTSSLTPTATPTGCAKIQITLSAPTPTTGQSVTLACGIYRPDFYCGSPASVTSITFHFSATGNTADQLQSAQFISPGFPVQTDTYPSGGATSALFTGSDLTGLGTGLYLVLNFTPSAAGTFEVTMLPSEVTGESDSGFAPLNFTPYPDSGIFNIGGGALYTSTITPTRTNTHLASFTPTQTPTMTATPTPTP
jgi:hypothetical protein